MARGFIATVVLAIFAMFGIASPANAIGTLMTCTPPNNPQPAFNTSEYPTNVPQFYDADHMSSADHNLVGYAYYSQGQAASPNYRFDSINWVGTPTYSASPSLPAGLTLNASTGEITGAPSVAQDETTYTIYAMGMVDTNVEFCIGWEFNLTVYASGGGGNGNQATQVPFTFATSTFSSSSDISNLASGTAFPGFTVSFAGISQGGQYDTLNTVLGDMQNDIFYPVTGAVGNNNSSYVAWDPNNSTCGVTQITLGGTPQTASSGITCTPMTYTYNGVVQYWLSIKLPTTSTSDVSYSIASGTFTTSGSGSEHGFFANAFYNTNSNNYHSSATRTFAAGSSVPVGAGSNDSSVEAVTMSFPVAPGQRIVGEDVTISATDLALSTDYSVVLRSTPQILASGRTVSSSFNTSVTIPDNLEAGWHSITFNATRSDGTAVAEVVYFKITADGTLLATSTDTPAELALTGIISAGAIPLSLIALLMGFIAFFVAREINPDFMRVMTLTRNENGELDFVKRRIRSVDF